MTQVPFRSADLFLTLHENGSAHRGGAHRGDVVLGVAHCGDLRIEVEVPSEQWPLGPSGFGYAETLEVELT